MKRFVVGIVIVAGLLGAEVLPSAAAQASDCPVFGPNTPEGSSLSTVAPKSPTAARLCHYAAGNEKAQVGTLVFSKTVADPRGLARVLNRSKTSKGVSIGSCPADYKGQDVVIFVSQGVESVVSIGTSGCRTITSNHTSGGWLLGNAALIALAKLDPVFGARVADCASAVEHPNRVTTPEAVRRIADAYTRRVEHLDVKSVDPRAVVRKAPWWTVGLHTCTWQGATVMTYGGVLPKGVRVGYLVTVTTDGAMPSGGDALILTIARVGGNWTVVAAGTSP